jgi:hypothetical protein
MKHLKTFFLPLFVFLVVGTSWLYAQAAGVVTPGISEIVGALMSAGGTYLAAYLVNMARVKWNIIPGSIFVTLIVPALGAVISYLIGLLEAPGNSWLMSFLVTLGSTWLSQVVAQLNSRTGAEQYLLVAPKP